MTSFVIKAFRTPSSSRCRGVALALKEYSKNPLNALVAHGQRSRSSSEVTIRCYHPSICVASDNLLGYSPMAPRSPSEPRPAGSGLPDKPSASTPSTAAIWGVDSNTAGGGVWAQTSAKKDKLNELLTELNAQGMETGLLGMESLDYAASSEEKLDLAFADGLKCIAKCVDGHIPLAFSTVCNETSAAAYNNQVTSAMQHVSNNTLGGTHQLFQMLSSASAEEEWARPKFEATMNEAIRILSSTLPSDPSLKQPSAGSLDMTSSLCYVREFLEEQSHENTDFTKGSSFADSNIPVNLQNEMDTINQIITQAFSTSVLVYKTLILRAVAITLQENWDRLTTITSGDIDRAAVSKPGSALYQQRTTVNAKCIQKLFDSYHTSPCCDWVKSWWELVDADNDGLIDQEEMNDVVDLAIKPIHLALKETVDLSLEVCPSRRVSLGKDARDSWFLGGDDTSSLENTGTNTNLSTNNKLTWRSRRAELSARKTLIKTFSSALARHFRDQVETPHRLRCIYAWAEKSHQNNKIDSVLVDASDEWGAASSIVGRKRYVELEPKISYQEFRDVQVKHFPQLDRVGEEIVMSFKEDLWVLQGKQRQNAELRRDCFLFLAGVSLVDLGIGML